MGALSSLESRSSRAKYSTKQTRGWLDQWATLAGAPARLWKPWRYTRQRPEWGTGTTWRAQLPKWERQLNRPRFGSATLDRSKQETSLTTKAVLAGAPARPQKLGSDSLDHSLNRRWAQLREPYPSGSTSSTANGLGVIHSTKASERQAQPIECGYPSGSNCSTAEAREQCSRPEQAGVRLTTGGKAAGSLP